MSTPDPAAQTPQTPAAPAAPQTPAGAAPPQAPDQIMVPKSRLDEEIAKRTALEAQVGPLQQAAARLKVRDAQFDLIRAGANPEALDDASVAFAVQVHEQANANATNKVALPDFLRSASAPAVLRGMFPAGTPAPVATPPAATPPSSATPATPATPPAAPPVVVRAPPAEIAAGTQPAPGALPKLSPAEVRKHAREGTLGSLARKA